MLPQAQDDEKLHAWKWRTSASHKHGGVMEKEGAAVNTSFPSWAEGYQDCAAVRTALRIQVYREYHHVARVTEHNTEGKECHQ